MRITITIDVEGAGAGAPVVVETRGPSRDQFTPPATKTNVDAATGTLYDEHGKVIATVIVTTK